jgi:hypothetical protein
MIFTNLIRFELIRFSFLDLPAILAPFLPIAIGPLSNCTVNHLANRKASALTNIFSERTT